MNSSLFFMICMIFPNLQHRYLAKLIEFLRIHELLTKLTSLGVSLSLIRLTYWRICFNIRRNFTNSRTTSSKKFQKKIFFAKLDYFNIENKKWVWWAVVRRDRKKLAGSRGVFYISKSFLEIKWPNSEHHRLFKTVWEFIKNVAFE